MSIGLTPQELMTINKEGPKSINTHSNALAKLKTVELDGGTSIHDAIKSRIRRNVGKSKMNIQQRYKDGDELYNQAMALKNSGRLPELLKKIKYKPLTESDGPIAPMGGSEGSGRAKVLRIKTNFLPAAESALKAKGYK